MDKQGHEPAFSIRFIVTCNRCGKQADAEVARQKWLDPYFVRHDDGWLQTVLCPDCGKWHIRFILKGWRIGKISSWIYPGYSSCGRCHTNWQFVEAHTTDITDASGMFALCKTCWAALAPNERLPYYREVWDDWGKMGYSQDRYSWQDVAKAVLHERN